jgi:hypothetical protein
MMATGLPATAGITNPVSETVLLNPPMLEIVTLTKPVEPRRTVRRTGLAVMLKSGTGVEEMVRVRVAVCLKEPLVPEKMMEYVPAIALLSTPTETPPLTFPPEGTNTGVRTPTPTPIGMFDGSIETSPLNPLRLVTVKVESLEVPIVTLSWLGTKNRLKSPEALALTDSDPTTV